MSKEDDRSAKTGEETIPKALANNPPKLSVSSARFDVEKFDGTNSFGMWQCEMLDILVQQGLDFVLEDKPSSMDETEWVKMNRLACGSIRLCLAKDVKYFVMRESMARTLWQKLEDKYMTKSMENRLYLKKKLFRFQFVEGTSMIGHLNAFNKLIADLLNLDEVVKDEDKALILLNSLPDSYEHLATTLIYGKDTVKFDDVSNALMNNEFRKRDKEAHNDTSEAFVTRERPEDRRTQFGNKSRERGVSSGRSKLANDECAYCREKGHWKNECPKLVGDRGANVVLEEEDSESDSDFVLATTVDMGHLDKWVLDSACSHHMSPNMECFTNLKIVKGGAVHVGNGIVCEKMGFGDVRLKLHDGTIKKLTDVWYVPDLMLNLISLGALESKGFKITMDDGGLKVSRGALIVLRGVREKNLYFLRGHSVVGGATTIDKKPSFGSKLPHMEVGQFALGTRQCPVEEGLLKSVKTRKVRFGEQNLFGEDTRSVGDTLVCLDGLIDVHSVDESPIGGVGIGVSPYVEKVECDSPLAQVGLEEVSPQPHLTAINLESTQLEGGVWSNMKLVATIRRLLTLFEDGTWDEARFVCAFGNLVVFVNSLFDCLDLELVQLNLNLDDDLVCDLVLVKTLLKSIVGRFKFKPGLDLDHLVC